jgi:hypothetical protein
MTINMSSLMPDCDTNRHPPTGPERAEIRFDVASTTDDGHRRVSQVRYDGVWLKPTISGNGARLPTDVRSPSDARPPMDADPPTDACSSTDALLPLSP